MKVVAIVASGRARASRAGSGARAIANIFSAQCVSNQSLFRRAAENSTQDARAPR